MTKCYEIPVTLFVNADTAEEALQVAGEELHYMCKGDHPVVAYDMPMTGANLTYEEEATA